MRRTPQTRLLSRCHIDPESGCWEWTGCTNNGYGRITIDGKQWGVHRLAAMLWLGFDPETGLWVLHRCDNPPCFNPQHLFIGTPADNAKDMVEKGRKPGGVLRSPRPRKEQSSRANNHPVYVREHKSLSPAEVCAIRELAWKTTLREIGQRYGVSHETVRKIWRGRSYKEPVHPKGE